MQKTLIPVLLLFIQLQANSQQLLQRYKDDVFTGSHMQTLSYGNNLNYQAQSTELQADIYLPDNDTAVQRAMIVFAHGGGFRNGSRNDSFIVAFCQRLALKGFVIASIDYRLGMDITAPKALQSALIRAVQDYNGFIRFAKANAAAYAIDTNKIFVSGASAGAIAAITKAYIKANRAAALGISSIADIEGNTNQLPNTSAVAGVYSLWGAITDTSWMENNDPPIGCVQSMGDVTVPWNVGYNKNNDEMLLYGSLPIFTRATNLGLTTTIHGYQSAKHDLGLKFAPYKDTTLQLMADFLFQIIQQIDASKIIKTGSYHAPRGYGMLYVAQNYCSTSVRRKKSYMAIELPGYKNNPMKYRATNCAG
jgi:hypothetical protein